MIKKNKKIKKIKKIKKTSLKSLRKRAWKIFSEYIRKRDKGKCITCGVVKDWRAMHAGHFVHKNSLDFNEFNINCQCVRCNKFLNGNLGMYAMALHRKYPEPICGETVPEFLIRKGKKVKKFTREEIEDIINEYGLKGKKRREDDTKTERENAV